MSRKLLLEIFTALLVMLFIYAALSKWLDMAAFHKAMHNQPFPSWMATFFIWSVPTIELIISLMLIIRSTQLAGLYASFLLMVFFTIYIAAILLHFFPRVPCSCGGVIKKLGWGQHLIFNLFFVLISVIGIALKRKSDEDASKEYKTNNILFKV